MMTQTGTHSPTHIDEKLSNLTQRMDHANRSIRRMLEDLHWAAGDVRRTIIGWRRSDRSVETQIREWARTASSQAREATGASGTPDDLVNAMGTLRCLDEARAELARCQDARLPLEKIFSAAPWSRFFLAGGDRETVHGATHCPTCPDDARYHLIPELSGLSEEDLVSREGLCLCPVCFPGAPVRPAARKTSRGPRCQGGRRTALDVTRAHGREYGTCAVCAGRYMIKSTGRPLPHPAGQP